VHRIGAVERLSILVVEDDPNSAKVLQELLSSSHDITTVGSAEAALSVMSTHSFDVALVDDRLPGAQGVDLTRMMRERWPDTVRVVVSGWVDPGRILKAVNEGHVYGFLEKPVEPDRLFAMLLQCAQLRSVMGERNKAMHRLETQNRELEEQVAVRTTELRERNEQLKKLATRDPLTGLYNRRYLDRRLAEEFHRLQRYGTPYSVVLLDIDDFKQVNDAWGHSVGDEVLKQVAGDLRAGLRQVDIVARYGGEEFLVLLPNTDADASLVTAQRLRTSFSEVNFESDGGPQSLRVTVSLGVSQASEDDPDWKTARERSDRALYQAKADGKNCVRNC